MIDTRIFDGRSILPVLLSVVVIPAVAFSGGPPSRMDLSGTWSVRLDPEDAGESKRWFATTLSDHTITLPGSLQAQGYGNEVTVDTKWTGGINDQSWYNAPKYEKYRQPVSVKAHSYNSGEPHEVAEKKEEFTLRGNDSATIEIHYPMGDDMQLWDEFAPSLYRLNVAVNAATGEQHYTSRKTVTFGMRDVTTQGTQLAVNGRPVFLRGTLECCIFPLTGYPPTDVESWKRVIRVCQAHGLNHMRFHSWCPPKAAFVPADELGFYLQAECGLWANQGSSVGDGKPVDRFLYKEQERILREYGNHLSNDGTNWGEPVAAGTWPNTKELKRVRFENPRETRYVKLVAESEVNGGVWASAAELEVMTE